MVKMISYIWHLSSLRTAIVKLINSDLLGAIGLALVRHGARKQGGEPTADL